MNVFEKSGKLVKHVSKVIGDKSPVILTGCAVAGVVTTVIFAVKATPKAEKILEQHKEEVKDMAPEEKRKAFVNTSIEIGKVYLPAIISGGVTIACIIGVDRVHNAKEIALATAYNLSSKELYDFKEKTREFVGDKKMIDIEDNVRKKHLDESSGYSQDYVIDTGHGNTLCYDNTNGRYFRSSPEWIKKCLMEAYGQLLIENWIPYDDIYYSIGLPTSKSSGILGIGIDDAKDLINFEGGGIFSSFLTENQEPVLVMDLPLPPAVSNYSGLRGWRD